MLFTLPELIDIVIMSLALGFIFKDIFKKKIIVTKDYDPIKAYTSFTSSSAYQNFIFAILVTAPAVILHEFGHKFMAINFGATATFNAAYLFLGIGILLKLMNVGFVFFVPAYVSWVGRVTAQQASMIAFAGPLVNLIIWLSAAAWLKYGKVNEKYLQFFVLTKKINMFLFIFNMIPIPGFDGYHVIINLINVVF